MSWGRAQSVVVQAWACVALMVAGCQPDSESARAQLSVFAASSLTEAFLDIERSFEAENPGVDVSLTFAGSQVLRMQIERSAPADVFASADASHVKALADAGLVADAAVFAYNELVVIVPPDNPAGIESFADLPRATRLVLGTPDVPVGAYTRAVLNRAAAEYGAEFESGVRADIASEESNARLVRAKIELGEADAAIVYRTDAVASERVRVVVIPDQLNLRTEYHAGRVHASLQPELARRWLAYLRSEAARNTLSNHGFLGPT